MADNGENILVEFDYDNITLIDPNKLVDQDGNVKERLVKQEDLVFYANLECNVLPRTKLAVGSAMNDQQRTISVGKINFLDDTAQVRIYYYADDQAFSDYNGQ